MAHKRFAPPDIEDDCVTRLIGSLENRDGVQHVHRDAESNLKVLAGYKF